MQELTYKYYRKRGAKIVYMILHGGGPVGVETDLYHLYLMPSQPLKTVYYVLTFRIAREKKRLRAAQN